MTDLAALEAKRDQIAAFVVVASVGSEDRTRAFKVHRLLSDLIDRNGGTPEEWRYVMQKINE